MLKSLILGIIQGISEFLPISSSGHLVVFSEYLNVSSPGNTLEIMLHVGTLFSVIVCFRDKIAMLFKDFFGLFKKGYTSHFKTNSNFILLIIVASIPAVVTGLFLDAYFESMFDSIFLVGVALIFTGIILFTSTKFDIGKKELKDLNFKDAFFIGILQSLAVIPGISRAGMSITAGLFKKYNRKTAAEWSFIMSLPVIGGAALLKIPDLIDSTSINFSFLVVGMLTSFIFGIIAIKILLRVIQSEKWKYFSYYCVSIGIILVFLNL
ncbi:MAG: undecaprenyl-diphosphate phosphatase [Clostridia bacterium]